MYLKLVSRRLSGGLHSISPVIVKRSRWVPYLVVTFLVLIPAAAWRLHRRGQFHSLRAEIAQKVQTEDLAQAEESRPGSQAPLVLVRSSTPDASRPEFLSTTLLPGRGLSVLQITALLPGNGEAKILSAPGPEMLARRVIGGASVADDDQGSFRVPWGGHLAGTTTPVGTSISTAWRGQTIEEPTEGSLAPDTAEALSLSGQAADSVLSKAVPGGMRTDAALRGVNGDGHWFSETEVHLAVQMTAGLIEISARARNSGDRPEPLGIGWHRALPWTPVHAAGRCFCFLPDR